MSESHADGSHAEGSHAEQHEEASRGAVLRNFVFGTSDGLVTVLAFVAGVSASLASRRLVLMAGLAEMFAGAVSMGLGAFLGTRAERETLERVVDVFTANEKRWVDIMMSEELGLQPVESSPWSAGFVVGCSYIV